MRARDLKDLRTLLDRRINFKLMEKKVRDGLADINEDVYIFFVQHEMKDYEHGGYKFSVMPGKKMENLDIQGLTRALAEKLGDVDEAVNFVKGFIKKEDGKPYIEGRKMRGGASAVKGDGNGVFKLLDRGA